MGHSQIVAHAAPAATRFTQTASLQDWRRQVADLYAQVRRLPAQEGWQLWRQVRDRLFAEHPQSPLAQSRRSRFAGIALYDYDPALRFAAALRPIAKAETIAVETGKDGVTRLAPYAQTNGLATALGKELTLYWIEGYGGGSFLPFSDATCGAETFAGGRYLLDTIKSADLGALPDGRLILDFNFAYYPSCAYSEAWICPLSPPENRVAVPVRGGERDARLAGV
jgi:hypothetical protein